MRSDRPNMPANPPSSSGNNTSPGFFRSIWNWMKRNPLWSCAIIAGIITAAAFTAGAALVPSLFMLTAVVGVELGPIALGVLAGYLFNKTVKVGEPKTSFPGVFVGLCVWILLAATAPLSLPFAAVLGCLTFGTLGSLAGAGTGSVAKACSAKPSAASASDDETMQRGTYYYLLQSSTPIDSQQQAVIYATPVSHPNNVLPVYASIPSAIPPASTPQQPAAVSTTSSLRSATP